MGDAKTFSAAAPDAFAASMAAGISSGLAIWKIESPTLHRRAASFSASSREPAVLLEFGNGRNASKSGHCLDQDFLPLAVKLGREEARASSVAVGAGQRLHQS